MSFDHASTCPPWCDPRAHIQHDGEDAEHRTAGMTWKPVAADTNVAVGAAQLENRGAFPSAGEVHVRLCITDLFSSTGAATVPGSAGGTPS